MTKKNCFTLNQTKSFAAVNYFNLLSTRETYLKDQPCQGPKLTFFARRQLATESFFSRQMEKFGHQSVGKTLPLQ